MNNLNKVCLLKRETNKKKQIKIKKENYNLFGFFIVRETLFKFFTFVSSI